MFGFRQRDWIKPKLPKVIINLCRGLWTPMFFFFTCVGHTEHQWIKTNGSYNERVYFDVVVGLLILGQKYFSCFSDHVFVALLLCVVVDGACGGKTLSYGSLWFLPSTMTRSLCCSLTSPAGPDHVASRRNDKVHGGGGASRGGWVGRAGRRVWWFLSMWWLLRQLPQWEVSGVDWQNRISKPAWPWTDIGVSNPLTNGEIGTASNYGMKS